jgi:hypothetical protein
MKAIPGSMAIVAMIVVFATGAFAQTSATQTVTLAVASVQKINVSGAAVTLTIIDGTQGTDALTSVSDASTAYNVTHNSNTALRITATLKEPLTTGYKLFVKLASKQGTTSNEVDISGGTAKEVVSSIAKGADANQTITYRFDANASAGPMESNARVVTFTLTGI